MIPTLYYFGTSFKTPGHYMWELENNKMISSRLKYEDVAFKPESVPCYKKGEKITKGEAQFHQISGYSIIAIEGSCADNRWGTKSVFFIKEVMSKDTFIELIKSNTAAMNIINALKGKYEVDV